MIAQNSYIIGGVLKYTPGGPLWESYLLSLGKASLIHSLLEDPLQNEIFAEFPGIDPTTQVSRWVENSLMFANRLPSLSTVPWSFIQAELD